MQIEDKMALVGKSTISFIYIAVAVLLFSWLLPHTPDQTGFLCIIALILAKSL